MPRFFLILAISISMALSGVAAIASPDDGEATVSLATSVGPVVLVWPGDGSVRASLGRVSPEATEPEPEATEPEPVSPDPPEPERMSGSPEPEECKIEDAIDADDGPCAEWAREQVEDILGR